jgi:LuxR family maltose regulon positive regulatory protein
MAALTLIVAPAGYGKTTLVGTWLAQLDLPAVWVSLDAGENDPTTFLTALIAAVAAHFVGFGEAMTETLSSPNGADIRELTTPLINELNEIEQEFVVVLDDYHVIHEPIIHRLLVDLMAYPPHGLHLVLATRYDPPLPWRMRTRSDLYELRAGDLSFTPEEAGQFLTRATERPISSANAKLLAQQAQGWITSLRLLALTMRRQQPGAAWSDLTTIELRTFDDYFAAEVLGDLEPPVLVFLQRTSILDIMSGPLCDVVAGPAPGGTGAALLHALEKAGAFTSALDDEEVWYRYHPLLRAALRRRLQQDAANEEIAELYQRASAWHERRGLLDEAMAYALEGTLAYAVAFLERHRHKLLDDYDWRRLERWLEQFPPEAINDYLELLLTKTWLRFWRYEVLEVGAVLPRLETLLAAQPPDSPCRQQWRGELLSLRGTLEIAAGNGEEGLAIALAALEILPPNLFWVRTFTLVETLCGFQMTGRHAAAIQHLATFTADKQPAHDLVLARLLLLRSYADLPQTTLESILTDGPKLLDLLTARTLSTALAWTHHFWGCACYLRNDLDGARKHYGAVLELVDYAHGMPYVNSAIGMALTWEALALPDEAAAVVEQTRRTLLSRRQSYVTYWIEAFAAELAARQGNVDAAQRWLAREGHRLIYEGFPIFYVPGLASVRILLAAGTENTLREAQQWLARQVEFSARVHNIHALIQCRALGAALHAAQQDRAAAKAALAEALALAEPGQIIRIFLDLAPHLEPLLDELVAELPPSAFTVYVHNALKMENQRVAPAAPIGGAPPGEAAASEQTAGRPRNGQNVRAALPPNGTADARDLQELLTYREMDVLKLLEERLTNKEIGQMLSISTETVRQHTVNLFRKLKVSNRRQAIVAARKWRSSQAPE